MKFQRYSAKHIFASLLTLFSIIAMAGLGVWQLQRMDEKEARLATIASRQEEGANLLSEVLTRNGDLRDWPVRFEGTPDPDQVLLLDNKIHNGQPGYEVLVPVNTNSGWIITNFGWVKGSPDKAVLPSVHIENGLQRFNGTLAQPGDNPMIRETAIKQGAFPKVIQQWDAQQISALTGKNISAYMVHLAADSKSPYVRDWQAVVMAPEKHLGYAIQWFLLAAAASVVWVVVIRRTAKYEQ